MRNKSRGQPFWLPLFLCGFALALSGGCASRGAAPALPTTPVELAQAVLEDEITSYEKDGTKYHAWRTYWVLRWHPVPGARGYQIGYHTSEGASRKTRMLAQTPLRLEVAKGDNPVAAGFPGRDIQLSTIQGMLSVRIAARFADDAVGPPSPWLPVGLPYP